MLITTDISSSHVNCYYHQPLTDFSKWPPLCGLRQVYVVFTNKLLQHQPLRNNFSNILDFGKTQQFTQFFPFAKFRLITSEKSAKFRDSLRNTNQILQITKVKILRNSLLPQHARRFHRLTVMHPKWLPLMCTSRRAIVFVCYQIKELFILQKVPQHVLSPLMLGISYAHTVSRLGLATLLDLFILNMF